LAIWLFIVGCPVSALALTQHELDASRSFWDVNGLNDYDYVLQRTCFCISEARRPGLVQVRMGAIATVTDAETLQPLDPLFFRTVDQLFDELQNAIDNSADDIQAEFDNTIGYPTSIRIDFDLFIADEELIYSARDLHVVEKLGDFNRNGLLDVDDLDSLTTAIATGNADVRFDIDQSGVVDLQDRAFWIKDLKHTWIGDANLSGEFTSGDLIDVLAAGTYEADVAAGWAAGDFNGDSRFNSSDLVDALADGGYEQGPRVAAVPEPSSLFMFVAGLVGIAACRRGHASA
jgi:hypothetical protein